MSIAKMPFDVVFHVMYKPMKIMEDTAERFTNKNYRITGAAMGLGVLGATAAVIGGMISYETEMQYGPSVGLGLAAYIVGLIGALGVKGTGELLFGQKNQEAYEKAVEVAELPQTCRKLNKYLGHFKPSALRHISMMPDYIAKRVADYNSAPSF